MCGMVVLPCGCLSLSSLLCVLFARSCARLCFSLTVSRVGVAVLACVLAVLLPCRNSAGARFARCSLSVVSCAIVSHVMPPIFVFRVFLASAARLSCGMMGVGKKNALSASGKVGVSHV